MQNENNPGYYNKWTKIEEIYSINEPGSLYINFNELPLDKILPTDKLSIEAIADEPYQYTISLEILREREETDEELLERMKRDQLAKEKSKEYRYEQYLKLKEEFETNNTTINE